MRGVAAETGKLLDEVGQRLGTLFTRFRDIKALRDGKVVAITTA